MPSDTGDFDEQDVAETFDEEMTEGLETDSIEDVYDATSARGDEDLFGDDDARDADESSDDDLEEIAEVTDQQEEDDLDDDDSDEGPLSVDNIPDDTNDRDFADEDDIDGVAGHEPDEAEVISMGDMTSVDTGPGGRVSDLESDNLSDSDLVELDYKEA